MPSESSKEDTQSSHERLGLLFVLLGVVLTIWAIYWVVMWYVVIPPSQDAYTQRGQFGDMFGAINALFSAFAFAGLIYTILLQRRELALQRAELTLTRTELAKSAEAQQKSYQIQILKEAYDYIVQTHKQRELVFANAEMIGQITTKEALTRFRQESSMVYDALREVANCYHYIGFLIHIGLLTAKEQIFEEGGHTVYRVWRIVRPILEIERSEPERGNYKQYFYALVADLDAHRASKTGAPQLSLANRVRGSD